MKPLIRSTRFLAYLIAFAALLFLRIRLAPTAHSDPLTFFLTVALISAGYMSYFIISEGHLSGIIASALISLALAAFAAVFPPFLIVLGVWVLYNLMQTGQLLKQLVPYALASFVLYALVFPVPTARFLGSPDLAGAPAGIAYLLFAVIYSARASRDPLKLGLFRLSTMLVSVPLIVLLIASIEAGLRNLFSQSTSFVDRRIKVAQPVRAHVRGGVDVAAYVRARPVTVSVALTETSVGAGGAVIGAAGQVAQDVSGESVS